MARKTYKKKIKNGKEYYFVRIYDEKRKPKDIYAKTTKEMDEKINKLKAEYSGDRSDSNMTFGEFFNTWMYNTHIINKKPSTRERYDGIYKNHIKDSPISKVKLKDLTVDKVQQYYSGLHQKGKSSNVIKNVHKLISPAIRFGAATGEISRDFSRLLVVPKDTEQHIKSEIKYLSKEQQLIFEKTLNDESFGLLYYTALYTGLRQGELFALTWADVDLDNQTISVNKTFKFVKDIDQKKREGIIGKPKTASSIRCVPITETLAHRLKEYKISEKEACLRYGSKLKESSLVFHNGVFRHLDSPNIRKDLNRIFESCGISGVRFHDLRHTYATRLFELGENAKTVQTLLGHSDIAITLNTYTHVSEKVTKISIKKLSNIFEEENKKEIPMTNVTNISNEK